MATEFETGTYAIPAPRPEEDAVSSYMEVAEAQQALSEDQQWQELLGNAGTATPTNPNASVTDAAPTPEAAAPAAPAQPAGDAPEDAAPAEGQTWQDYAKAALMDMGEGAVEAPRQAVGGMMEAVTEAGEFVADMFNIGELQITNPETGELDLDLLSREEVLAQREEFPDREIIAQMTPPEADSVTGNFVRSTAQFLTGFIPALRGTRALGVTGAVSSTMVAGAVADAVVFDPHEDRLSTYLNEFPALEPFVSDYLADNNPDNESD